MFHDLKAEVLNMRLYYVLIIMAFLVIAGCTTQPENNTNDNSPVENTGSSNNQPVQQTPADNTKNQSTSVPQETIPKETKTPTENQVTLSELSTHNSKSDCWVAYQGKVYDVTAWLPLHPGGPDAIAKYCGSASEFEQGFTKKHGTTKVSVLLQQIYKGDLV